MSVDDKFTSERITEIKTWAPSLFSFKTTRYRGFRFVPGQFARLGLEKDGKIIWRAYSMVSAAYDEHLEFYSIVVPDGEFTSQLSRFKPGDEILVDKTSFGFLTTDRFENGKDLWLLATGTGLAPFLSILRDFDVWQQYENLILVHSVRHAEELGYREQLEHLDQDEVFGEFAHKFKYLQIVTREPVEGALHERITQLIRSGGLEAAAGLPFDHQRSRFMLCGNPEMVDETRKLLQERGFTPTRSARPGHFAVENAF